MAALLAVVSLLPLVGFLRDVLIRPGPGTLQAASICLLSIVSSLFDHLVRVRSLKPLPKERYDGDV